MKSFVFHIAVEKSERIFFLSTFKKYKRKKIPGKVNMCCSSCYQQNFSLVTGFSFFYFFLNTFFTLLDCKLVNDSICSPAANKTYTKFSMRRIFSILLVVFTHRVEIVYLTHNQKSQRKIVLCGSL